MTAGNTVEVLPLGPFPPVGAEAPGQIDLGVRLRDEILCAEYLVSLRPKLLARLEEAVGEERAPAVAELIQAYVDTWPVASLIDEARAQWTTATDGNALAVLARAAALVRTATGLPALSAGPWPLPDHDWIRAQVGEGSHHLLTRGSADGSEPVAAALGLTPTGAAPCALSEVGVVAAGDLVSQRAALGRRLALDEIAGVEVLGPLPDDPATQLALGELRLEGRNQRAVAHYGRAAADLSDIPEFREVLAPPPPGQHGPNLQRRCDIALLPGTPEQALGGHFELAGWLVWSAPHPPVPVHPAAAMLLNELEVGFEPDGWAEAHSIPREMVDDLIVQLVELGAASA